MHHALRALATMSVLHAHPFGRSCSSFLPQDSSMPLGMAPWRRSRTCWPMSLSAGRATSTSITFLYSGSAAWSACVHCNHWIQSRLLIQEYWSRMVNVEGPEKARSSTHDIVSQLRQLLITSSREGRRQHGDHRLAEVRMLCDHPERADRRAELATHRCFGSWPR
jgi:hypothetical protein